jgi:hypothetical protein
VSRSERYEALAREHLATVDPRELDAAIAYDVDNAEFREECIATMVESCGLEQGFAEAVFEVTAQAIKARQRVLH